MPTVKILPGKILPASSRLLACVAVAALLTSACATSVPGAPAPQPDRPSAQAAPPGPRPPGSPASCRVTASSTGSISSSGAGGRTVTVNGRTSFSCGSGALVAIDAIDASGVTFSADGAAVSVAAGSAATVGAYRISVTRVEAGTAEFEVEPAG